MPDSDCDALYSDRRTLLGLTVTSGRPSAMVAALAARVSIGEVTRVAFLNAHLSNVCASRPDLRRRLQDFVLFNDGVGLDIAARVLHGHAFPANLNGTDLTTALLDEEGHRWRIFCLGAKEHVVAEAAKIFERRWPQHELVGYHHGYVNDASGLERTIRAANPDLVIVGMGNPRQEIWLSNHIPDLCPVGIAVGAWFDFLTATVPRAPSWMRRARLEWLFRLALEPRRLAARYLLGNPLFLLRVLRARLALAFHRSSPALGKASR